MKPSRDIGRLLEIMAALRTPGTGCPWDLEQDFSTIAPYTLEEAYEVADAIARGFVPFVPHYRQSPFASNFWIRSSDWSETRRLRTSD